MANGSISRHLLKAILCLGAVAGLPGCNPGGVQAAQAWEPYVSRHCTFTLQIPKGWKVREVYQERPRRWGFSVEDPAGHSLARSIQGPSPNGLEPEAALRGALLELARGMRDFKPAPMAKMGRLDNPGGTPGGKRLVVLDGTYTDGKGQRRQFRTLLTCSGGLLLEQRIEAREGRLQEAAPLLLQTLANLKVAKGIFPSDEGGSRLAEPSAGAVPPLAPRKLASGWAGLSLPQGWLLADLGKGACLASDPARRLYVMVAGAEFVAPRYFVPGVPGVLRSEFRSPSDAFAFSAAQTGQASGFEFSFIKQRPDLAATLSTTAGPLRPVAVEDFGYTCTVKGRRYQGFSTGGCSGDAMRASWRLWHFTLMAPAEEFTAALPTLASILGSYELNREMAGRRIADNLNNYYAGLKDLGNRIARNSEQMRRENLEGFMERGRVQDYISYQTTRTIMGEFDYLAGASGYVRGDASGLYGADGNQITRQPYGESVTRNLQEINSRSLFEAVRPR